jgi:hypothetical protein
LLSRSLYVTVKITNTQNKNDMTENIQTPEVYDPTLDLSPLPTDALDQVWRSYLDGAVRQYAVPGEGGVGVQRTEIDIPDGRVVKLHKNAEAVMYGLKSPRWNRITIEQDDGELLGVINLEVDSRTSPTNPGYNASVGGRQLATFVRGDALDLELADSIYPRAVSREKGVEHHYGVFGDAGSLDEVVDAMRPGFSPASISELFEQPRTETPALREPMAAEAPSGRPKGTPALGKRIGNLAARIIHRGSH